MKSRLLVAAAALCALFAVTGSASATVSTLTVSPGNLNGWTIAPDPPVGSVVTYNFTSAPPASLGTGALRFAVPVGAAGANKFIMNAPYTGLVSDLTSFSYDFYVDPSSPGTTNAKQFYVNLYVDSAANGVGVTASFYDCRYDLVPSSLSAYGTWLTKSFNQASAWTAVVKPLASCPNTLAALPATSKVLFLVMNGGDTGTSDNGVTGYYDNVVLTTPTDTTTYDFGNLLCAPGSYSATGLQPCTAASPGNFVSIVGATSQVPCSPGYFQPSSGQTSCIAASPGNVVPFIGSSFQTPCAPGFYQGASAATTCIAAPAGTFAAGTGNTAPTPCGLGTFAAFSASAFCTPAPPGSFVGFTGASFASLCPAGTFQPASGQSSCNNAPAGYFVPAPGGLVATPCAAGKYQPNVGQSFCFTTTPGHYSGAAAANQTPCDPGTYQPAFGASSCITTDPGNYSGSGQANQTPCAPGTYQPGSGASMCLPADAGSYVDTAGSVAQTPCAAGTFQPNTGAASCNLADPGNFVSGTGATGQTPCAAGTYQPSSGASSCLTTDPGSYSGPGQANQTACPLGSYQPNAGATTCLLADVGYYVDTTGSASQTKCPAGTTTATVGSTSAAACSANATKLDVLSQLDSAIATYLSKKDNEKLKQARKSLVDSLDPSLWIDGNHLVAKSGEKVFQNEKEAAQKLSELIKEKSSGIPDALLLGWVETLVAVDRSLATTALGDSNVPGADGKKLDEGNKEIAKGDDAAAKDRPDAIEHYKNAWKKAMEAVKKL